MPRLIPKTIKPYNIPPLITLSYQEQSTVLLQRINISKFAYRRNLLQQYFHQLVYLAKELDSYSLCTNQIDCYQRMFIMSQSQPHHQLWVNPSYAQSQYQCIINPSVLQAQNLCQRQEQCLSLPFMIAKVCRYEHILVQYTTLNQQTLTKQLKGTCARIFQHNMDHLQGRILLDWRVNHGNISLQSDIRPHFDKTSAYLEQFTEELFKTFKKYPQLIKLPSSINNHMQSKYTNNDQSISYQDDYTFRIAKAYRKEMTLFMERINLNHINQ